jgi:hypothetical protein
MSDGVFQPITPEEVVQQLRSLRDRIPDFTQLPPAEVRALSRAASVDPRAIQSAINAVGDSEALRGALGTSAEELRQEGELNERWNAIIGELQAMLKGARAAQIVRRHRLGLIAMQVYQISRQLARRKEHANLLPHVAAMRQRFAVARRAKPVDPSKPEPQPEPLAQSKPPAAR